MSYKVTWLHRKGDARAFAASCNSCNHSTHVTNMNDLKFAFRQLLKNPGFTAVAVLTLALGIGANTTIFTVAYGVLLKPLPLPQSERLVNVWEKGPGGRFSRTPVG